MEKQPVLREGITPQPAVPRPPRAARESRPLSVHRFRSVFQLFFLLVFLGLLTATFWPVFTGLVSGFLLADPLIAANSAAHGLFRWEMLLAVPVLLSPLFLGRVFCGYACPMGFLIELFGPKGRKKDRALRPGVRTIVRKVPLFGLLVVLVFILLGSAWFLVADPISLFTRSATTLLYPALDRLLTWGGDLLYRVDAFKAGVDTVTNTLSGRLVFESGLHFALQILTLMMFVAILAFSWVERRLWCRHLCPLGAFLGLIGRLAPFGRVVDGTKCTSCKACVKACPMDAIRDDGRSTDMSRCECGLECADACRQGAVRWGYKPQKQYAYDPSRRALLAGAAVAFAAGFGVFKLLHYLQPLGTATAAAAPEALRGPGGANRPPAGTNPGAPGATGGGSQTTAVRTALIRPPGALAEADFLATCTRCDECLKVCPTNVLQPAGTEAGLEGTFSPRLDFAKGFCEYNCAECGKVCPTRSIAPLTLAEKQRAVIGVARIDTSRCLPYAQGKECLVCEELCPLPRKAIVFGGQGGRGREDVAGESASAGSTDSATAPAGLKLPRVEDRHCIGCGICQFNCPIQDPTPAIVVMRGRERG